MMQTPAPSPEENPVTDTDAPTHYAIISTELDMVAGNLCDLSVVTAGHIGETASGQPQYGATDNVVWHTELPVPVDDPERVAKSTDQAGPALNAAGWEIITQWAEAGDRAWYAEVTTTV